MRILVLLLALFATLSLAERVRYDGFKLIRAEISPERLAKLESKLSLDVWSQRPHSADIMVSPSQLSSLLPHLKGYAVLERNIQRQIDEESVRKRMMWDGVGTADGFFDSFRPYSDFDKFYDDLVATYPSLVTKKVIGKSIQQNDIIELVLTTGGSKPAIYVEATVHAREWLAPTTALFSLASLLENFSKGDQTALELVESVEWHFTPIVNVDGYLYTWSNDRLWRKNRRQNVGSSAYGVDLNRNHGPNSTWCTAGSSKIPSSDTYCGTGAFSEPEIVATSESYGALSNLAGVIAFHTYGPLLLHPYQYSYDPAPEPYNTEVSTLGKEMEAAINAVHGARYESIQGSDLYPHSGGTIDWAYLTKNVPAFTIEIRGNSFIVPDTEIVLAGEENYAGLVVFAEHILSK